MIAQQHAIDQIDGRVPTGFTLLKIGMSRFLSYRDPVVVDFSKFKTTAITGPTGAGKTSLLDGMTFAFYGKSTRTEAHITIDEFVLPGGYVLVEFAKNGNVYFVKRGRSSDGASIMELKINGNKFNGNTKAITSELERILGMNYDAFTSSSIIRQKEINLFSSMTPAERLSTLQSLFQLKIFEKALERAKIDKATAESEMTSLRGETEALRHVVENENELAVTIASKQSEITDARGKEAIFKKKLEQIDDELQSLRKENEAIIAAASSRDEMSRNVSGMKVEADGLREEIARDDEAVKSKGIKLETRASLVELRAVSIKRDAIKLNMDSIRIAREKVIEDQKSQYERLVVKYQGGIGIDEYTDVAIDVGKIEASGDTKKLSSAKKKLSKLKPDLVKGVVSSVLVTEMNASAEHPDEDAQLADLDASMVELATRIGSKTTSSIDDELNALSIAEGDMQSTVALIAEKGRRLASITEDICKKNEAIDALNGKISGASSILSDITGHEDQSKKINDAILKFEQSIAEANGIIVSARTSLAKVNEYKDVIASNDSKIKMLEDKIDILTTLVESVLHKRGVPMYAVETVIGSIEMRASEIVNYMTDGQKTIVKFTTTGQGYEIFVDDKTLAALSGGEQTQVNAAIRFAIAEKLSEISTIGAEMKTLFVDEGDLGSLDNFSARQRFMDVVMELAKYFNKIIFITHMPELVVSFDHKIRVSKDEMDVSRVNIDSNASAAQDDSA